MKKRIGIFGGTFNPIHVGHAIIANSMLQQGIVDQLWFMVSPLNPFKVSDSDIAPDVHRLCMAELVARNVDGLVASAFEFNLPKPSYTIDTLNALTEKFPESEFVLIIGADNWAAFDRWYKHDEILERFQVVVYPRLGHQVDIPDALKGRVILADAPVIEISSTMIRECIAQGKDFSFLVIEPVAQYITNNRLYVPQKL